MPIASALTAVAVVGVLAASAGPAAAESKTKAPAPLPAAPLAAPNGYQIVDSGTLTAPAGSQTRGTVSCPGSAVVLGGGVYALSSSLDVNLNSSFPSGRTWIGDVNNASSSDTTFSVQAICAAKPKGYTLVTAVATNPAQTQTHLQAMCPGHKVAIGGGEASSSTSLAVNVNTSIPVGQVWTVEMNNNTSVAETFSVIAICARTPAGFARVESGPVLNRAGHQTAAQVACPPNTVPLSGGALSSSFSIAVNINSTSPIFDWIVYENNASAADAQVTAFLVCAGG